MIIYIFELDHSSTFCFIIAQCFQYTTCPPSSHHIHFSLFVSPALQPGVPIPISRRVATPVGSPD